MSYSYTVVASYRAITVILTLLAFFFSTNSEVEAIMCGSCVTGSKIWVKVANETVWWPSVIISDLPSADNVHCNHNDPFSDVGIENTIVVQLLGTSKNTNIIKQADSNGNDSQNNEKNRVKTHEKNRVTALRLSDQGKSWDFVIPSNQQNQTIPEYLKAQYATAILESKLNGRNNNVQSSGVSSGEEKENRMNVKGRIEADDENDNHLRFDSISLTTPSKVTNTKQLIFHFSSFRIVEATYNCILGLSKIFSITYVKIQPLHPYHTSVPLFRSDYNLLILFSFVFMFTKFI